MLPSMVANLAVRIVHITDPLLVRNAKRRATYVFMVRSAAVVSVMIQ